MKKIFTTDLDGTVIYSEKHEFNSHKRLVETNGDYKAYMNEKLYSSLDEYNKQILFVPVTTRSIGQYRRINFPIVPRYALVLNGAILLKNGEIDKEWLCESYKMCEDYQDDLLQAVKVVKCSGYKCSHIDLYDIFFLFIKTESPSSVFQLLCSQLNLNNVTVYRKNGKIYVIPKPMEKGMAVKRLKDRFDIDFIIAAGDSDMDKSMLDIADKTISCQMLKEKGDYCNE